MKPTSRIKTAIGIFKRAFLTKIYGILGALGLFSTLTGYNLQHIVTSLKGSDYNNLFVGNITLIVTITFIFIRYSYVAISELYQLQSVSQNHFSPIKFTKRLKQIIKDTNSLLDGTEKTEKTKNQTLSNICDNIKYIFDNLTCSDCSVSIKLITTETTDGPRSKEDIFNLEVVNLVRDRAHSARDTEAYKQAKHLIRENTAFSTVIAQLIKNNSIATIMSI